MQRYELETWLGPALAELSTEQVDELLGIASGVEARGLDTDGAERAMTTAVQGMLGELDPLERVAARHQRAAVRAAETRVELYERIQWAVQQEGMSEKRAAEVGLVDRMTVRKILGKR